MGLKDKNIVRLLGYCAEAQPEILEYEGKMVLVQRDEKLLCFEYLRGGNLDAHITDASHGFGWIKRYKIIKGICEGLSYLHQNLTIHLDLKPATICLDEKKLPKILAFCCSRRIEEKQSEVILEDRTWTLEYMVPEILDKRVATFKSDINSLGWLIMEILTGHREYYAVENVLKSWAGRLGTSLEDTRLEQIRVCAEIAISCLEHDPKKRPDAEHIIELLVETESRDEFTELDEMDSVDEFTESDAQVSISRVIEVTKLHLLEFGHITLIIIDELRGLEWHTRYKIILGISKDLLYLHKEKDIIHMDLKPANILLDDLVVPKITDFGLSRLDNNSQAATMSRLISPGYCAPEYFLEGKSFSKSDIYSLGVMDRELVRGSKKEPDLTKEIPCLDDVLGIEPLEIHFPFELDPQISHSIELTNDTDDYIAFMMKARLRYFRIEPDKGIVPPRSKCSVATTMQAQVNALPNNHYKEGITVLSTRVVGGLAPMDITRDVFIEKEGTVLDEVTVMVVFDKPPSAEES